MDSNHGFTAPKTGPSAPAAWGSLPARRGIIKFALLTPASHLPDRRRGCAGSDDHDPAAAVLRREARRGPVSGGLADRRVRRLPVDLRTAAGAALRSHGAQAAA